MLSLCLMGRLWWNSWQETGKLFRQIWRQSSSICRSHFVLFDVHLSVSFKFERKILIQVVVCGIFVSFNSRWTTWLPKVNWRSSQMSSTSFRCSQAISWTWEMMSVSLLDCSLICFLFRIVFISGVARRWRGSQGDACVLVVHLFVESLSGS